MRATVTVVTAHDPRGEPVAIEADGATSSAEIASEIAAALGATLTSSELSIDGEPVDPAAPLASTPLRDGAIVVLGHDPRGAVSAEHDQEPGWIAFAGSERRVNRPPRLCVVDPTAAAREIAFPSKPQERPPARLPVIATVAPLVAGLALAAVMRRPEYLLFTVLSPVMMAGQWVADRVGQRRAARTAAAAYESALSTAHATLADALVAELSARRAWAPEPAAVADIALTPTHRLWSAAETTPTSLCCGSAPAPSAPRPRRAAPTSSSPPSPTRPSRSP